MKDKLYRAFNEIRADEAILEKTVTFLNGERIKRETRRNRPGILRLAGALAAVIILVIGVFGYNSYFTAVAYVSIDVNPSVELMLNRYDRVIGSSAFNADGEQLLQAVNLDGKKYDEALSLLVTRMEQDGVWDNTPLVSMTVQTISSYNEQKLCDALLICLNTQVNDIQTTAEVEVFPVSAEIRENAHGCQMSPAKYLAIQELLEVDDTATLEQYSQSSIRQIRQRTQQCREEHGIMGGNGGTGENDGMGGRHGEGQKQGNGNGQGHGNGQGRGYGRGRQ